MKILTVNIGSGSRRLGLFEVSLPLPQEPETPLCQGAIEATFPGMKEGERLLTVQAEGTAVHREVIPANVPITEATEMLWRELRSTPGGCTLIPGGVDAVAHRVVHGGAEFSSATRITPDVEASIRRHGAFAPLHNPYNLEGIRLMRRFLGEEVPQWAIFDTSFHRTLPEAAVVYPIPYEWFTQGVRRYGFHGTSFQWASKRAAQLLRREQDDALRLILCHLGGGCSLAATVGGRCLDTTMGFTPLDGIAMCTRSGAIDPGILLHLLRQGLEVDDLEQLLNQQSGLKGVSGLAGDSRIVLAGVAEGNARAALAMEVFLHSLRGGIGRMLAALGELPDALVFTDAIGEDEPSVRAQACAPFQFLGIRLDAERNQSGRADLDISQPESRVRVLVIRGQEDWEMACQTVRVQVAESPLDSATP